MVRPIGTSQGRTTPGITGWCPRGMMEPVSVTIRVQPSQKPNHLFNAFERLIAAWQMDTRPRLSRGRNASVVVDNGLGASVTLLICSNDEAAATEAERLRSELDAKGFDTFARDYDLPRDFLARHHAGFWKLLRQAVGLAK